MPIAGGCTDVYIIIYYNIYIYYIRYRQQEISDGCRARLEHNVLMSKIPAPRAGNRTEDLSIGTPLRSTVFGVPIGTAYARRNFGNVVAMSPRTDDVCKPILVRGPKFLETKFFENRLTFAAG